MSKLKFKISHVMWDYIGYKHGWKRTILSKILSRNGQLFKVAAVSREEVENVVRSNINMSGYEKGYILRDNESETILDSETARQKLFEGFMQIYARDKSFGAQIDAYASNKRPFSLSAFSSVESGKKYLIPAFNGVGLSQLKSVFSASIPAMVDIPANSIDVAIGEQKLKGVTNIEDIVKLFNRAGFIVKNGTVEIGTIGSRSTNWDTSYSMHLDGANYASLIEAITKFTDIKNMDVRNTQQNTNEYDLTMASEVRDLMTGLGLGDLFASTVKSIKKFEIDNNLKAIYNRYHKIPNYAKRTKIETIDLSKYEEEVFTALFSKVMDTFSKLIADAGISDAQEVFAIAYSMGTEGNLMNDQSLKELVSLAA